jgi:hypothetical protein
MSLGNSRPRNWGKEQQEIALRMAMAHHKVAYQLRQGYLYLANTDGVNTLPFNTSFATISHISRGKWESFNVQDGKRIATGCSLTDLLGRTIHAVLKDK